MEKQSSQSSNSGKTNKKEGFSGTFIKKFAAEIQSVHTTKRDQN